MKGWSTVPFGVESGGGVIERLVLGSTVERRDVVRSKSNERRVW